MVYAPKSLEPCPLCEGDGVELCEGEEAPTPVYSVNCLLCYGEDAECVACTGTGDVHRYACPRCELEASPVIAREVMRWLRAYQVWDRRKLPPVRGGALDQSASFLRACEIADSMRGRIEQEEADRQELERERMQRAMAAREAGRGR